MLETCSYLPVRVNVTIGVLLQNVFHWCSCRILFFLDLGLVTFFQIKAINQSFLTLAANVKTLWYLIAHKYHTLNIRVKVCKLHFLYMF